MSDAVVSTRVILAEIAKNADALAVGLQGVAPPGNKPSNSILYLEESALNLQAACQKIDDTIQLTIQNPRPQ